MPCAGLPTADISRPQISHHAGDLRSHHRQGQETFAEREGIIRKFTRNRKTYPNEDSALKLIYLAIRSEGCYLLRTNLSETDPRNSVTWVRSASSEPVESAAPTPAGDSAEP